MKNLDLDLISRLVFILILILGLTIIIGVTLYKSDIKNYNFQIECIKLGGTFKDIRLPGEDFSQIYCIKE